MTLRWMMSPTFEELNGRSLSRICDHFSVKQLQMLVAQGVDMIRW